MKKSSSLDKLLVQAETENLTKNLKDPIPTPVSCDSSSTKTCVRYTISTIATIRYAGRATSCGSSLTLVSHVSPIK